ncbi:transposase domain-containing protein [Streptomyces sp. CG1]|uniref:transposase domain-containing protein n=1 Tax=Streptomyces sp. CG1 TaxID=1287523 RepID=UPI0034E19A87
MFAPGHLGALTRYLPFELVDDALDRPGRRGRTRTVPARVAVYFVLALALFPDASYGRVWDTLAGALRQAGRLVASVTAAGLACVRRRVGPDPLRELLLVGVDAPWALAVLVFGSYEQRFFVVLLAGLAEGARQVEVDERRQRRQRVLSGALAVIDQHRRGAVVVDSRAGDLGDDDVADAVAARFWWNTVWMSSDLIREKRTLRRPLPVSYQESVLRVATHTSPATANPLPVMRREAALSVRCGERSFGAEAWQRRDGQAGRSWRRAQAGSGAWTQRHGYHHRRVQRVPRRSGR